MNCIVGYVKRVAGWFVNLPDKLPELEFALVNYPGVWLPERQEILDTTKMDEGGPGNQKENWSE
jgi:hypothetical protein